MPDKNCVKIVAMRGRNVDNPSDRAKGIELEQRIEPRKDEVTNTLTTVQKDNLLLTNCTIRKLTPKECWRLMGWSDEQIAKVEQAGVSASQRYKQSGNGIVVDVLMAIFKNLFKENLK
jgi:DNA (cytosine-5)-methyltransferase 1